MKRTIKTLIFAILTLINYMVSYSMENNDIFDFITPGDLIFEEDPKVPSKSSEFSKAVLQESVLNTNAKDIIHVSIVYDVNHEKKTASIVEASYEKKEVSLISVEELIERARDKEGISRIHIGEVNGGQHSKVACEYVKNKIGLPYDFLFEGNEDSFYCSSLIFHAFKSVPFPLHEMSFNYPGSTFWKNYFASYKTSIPVGRLGSHPARMMLNPCVFIKKSWFRKF